MALKRIRLQGKQKETVDGFIDEIKLLKRLRGKDNIVQIVDAEVCPNEGLILVVLEFGEIDLAKMLNKRERQRAESGHSQLVDDNFMRLYFEQMVEAVKTIHEARIVHSDLKPANCLQRRSDEALDAGRQRRLKCVVRRKTKTPQKMW